MALGFAGANVTIPHKTAVVAFCDELDEVAERAGSVNTLVVRDGRVLGSSTDGPAVSARRGGGRPRPRARRGRGSPGRRDVAPRRGRAVVTVAARDPERAHALASGCARSSRSGRSRPRATGPRRAGRDPARQRDADPRRGPRPARRRPAGRRPRLQAGRLRDRAGRGGPRGRLRRGSSTGSRCSWRRAPRPSSAGPAMRRGVMRSSVACGAQSVGLPRRDARAHDGRASRTGPALVAHRHRPARRARARPGGDRRRPRAAASRATGAARGSRSRRTRSRCSPGCATGARSARRSRWSCGTATTRTGRGA